MVAAQEWAGKLNSGAAGPRLTDARSVEQSATYRPNTGWTLPASAQIADAPVSGGSNGTGVAGWPKIATDRNWAAYDNSTAPGVSAASDMGAQAGINAANRGLGSAYGGAAPTPETASNYRLPATASSDTLPPLEPSLPRY